jgi:hypothetical protein
MDDFAAEIIAVVVAPLDVLIAIFAGWSLLRHRRAARLASSVGFSPKQQFHVVIIICMLWRASYHVGMVWYARGDILLAIMSVWADLAALLYWLSFVLLLVFWMEFLDRIRRLLAHHPGVDSPFQSTDASNRGEQHSGIARTFRRGTFVAVAVVALIYVAAFSVLLATNPGASDDSTHAGDSRSVHIFDTAMAAFFALVGVCVAAGFVVVGRDVSRIISETVPGVGKATQVRRVVATCVVVSVCFLVRAIMTLVGCYLLIKECFLGGDEDGCTGSPYVLSWPWILTFYVIFEVLPFTLMVLLLRKNPKGGSDDVADDDSVRSPLLTHT